MRRLLHELALGARFALGGGREGLTRTALTALGTGLGVALLLLAASVPHIMAAREAREAARTASDWYSTEPVQRSDRTVVHLETGTEYRGDPVAGELLRADGRRPVLPPGLVRMPAEGEMFVSPALGELLASDGGALLKERLGARVAGTIGDEGLHDPGDLRYYAGSDTLTTANGGSRTAGYGTGRPHDPVDAPLLVLIVLICVVLLVPVAVFLATAARFGGERRDQRLAALRLTGADVRATRRIAAGEALLGSLLGLAVGAGVFAVSRLFAGSVRLWDLGAFPHDVVPAPWAGALVLVAVPLCAVVTTLVAMRAVTVEPLGVVRETAPVRRRLWWRLAMPLAGVGVLLAIGRVTPGGAVDTFPVAAGAILVLLGLSTLLPWLVDAVVRRLGGAGPLPWQLAVRRLQLGGGAAARAVSGITVAVAGAIALQMLFAGMHADFARLISHSSWAGRMSVLAEYAAPDLAPEAEKAFRATPGVRDATAVIEASAVGTGPVTGDESRPMTSLVVASCPTLRRLAEISDCSEGDAFVVHRRGDAELNRWIDRTARKGRPVDLNNPFERDRETGPLLWTLPAGSPTVPARPDAGGEELFGIFATPGALSRADAGGAGAPVDPAELPGARTIAQVHVDEGVPDAAEHVRNTAARLSPLLAVREAADAVRDQRYASVQKGLLAGASGTLALIAASLVVAQIEQLRERRRLLSVLVAFGTRRATLAWSVLWQTALPVALGMVVATAGGLALGAVMLRMTGKAVSDWWVFVPLAGAGAGVVAGVTLLSLPALWRLMRADGLRTE